MKESRSFSGLLIITVTALGSIALADEARDVFDSLYKASMSRVVASREKTDDLDLARDMLRAANDAKDHPRLLTLLCEHTHTLSARLSQGQDIAVDAMQTLATHVPEKRLKCLDEIARVRQMAYAASSKSAKPEAGRHWLNAMIALAAARQEQNDFTGAVAMYRRALATARKIDPDQIASLEHAIAVSSSRRQAAILKAKIKKNPGDKAAATELLRVLIVEIDDPREAAHHAVFMGDVKATEMLTFAMRDVSDLGEDECVAVGNWYQKHADKAKGHARRAMLSRVERFYGHYLALGPSDGLTRTRIALSLKEISAELKQVGGSVGERHHRPAPKSKKPAKKGFAYEDGVDGIAPEGKAIIDGVGRKQPQLFRGYRGVELFRVYDAGKLASRSLEKKAIAGAHGSIGLTGTVSNGAAMFGPYHEVPAGDFVAVFRFRRDDDGRKTIKIDVAVNQLFNKSSAIEANQMPRAQWVEHFLPFTFSNDMRRVEFRMWAGGRTFSIDRVYVFRLLQK